MFKVPKDEDIQAVLEAYDVLGKTAEKVRYVVLMLGFERLVLACIIFKLLELACRSLLLPPCLPSLPSLLPAHHFPRFPLSH